MSDTRTTIGMKERITFIATEGDHRVSVFERMNDDEITEFARRMARRCGSPVRVEITRQFGTFA